MIKETNLLSLPISTFCRSCDSTSDFETRLAFSPLDIAIQFRLPVSCGSIGPRDKRLRRSSNELVCLFVFLHEDFAIHSQVEPSSDETPHVVWN